MSVFDSSPSMLPRCATGCGARRGSRRRRGRRCCSGRPRCRLEHYALGRRLERGAAGVDFLGVAAHDGQNRGVAAGGQHFRHGAHAADLTGGGERVDMRDVGALERSHPRESGHAVVGHAVSDDKYIFHWTSLLYMRYGIISTKPPFASAAADKAVAKAGCSCIILLKCARMEAL